MTENQFSSAFSSAFDAPAAVDDCAWPIDASCAQDEWDAFPPAVQVRAAGLATATLRRLSGYRVGGCPITVRPCVRSCWDSVPAYYGMGPGWAPRQLADGSWTNSCGCTTECSCTALCEVVLAAPVGPISWVKVDGTDLLPTEYRVDGNRLVWTGEGECPWPACQDMAADETAENTFALRYLNAHAPDGLAQYAAGVLAVEFAKACTGGKCRLPASVTSLSRQGVSYDIAAGTFPDGSTGIREVDAWIGLWRPEGSPTRQSTVWFPGQRYPRVVGA